MVVEIRIMDTSGDQERLVQAYGRENVPDPEKCLEYLSGHLDKWVVIIGAIHEGHEEALRKRAAGETPSPTESPPPNPKLYFHEGGNPGEWHERDVKDEKP